MSEKPIQHQYTEKLCHCYGCGYLNRQGLQIKSYFDGSESEARFTPEPHHIALPGFVYGGLLASLVDCHGVATAAAIATSRRDAEMNCSMDRYVTASLHVYFMKPTPLGEELILKGRFREERKNKIVVEVDIRVGDEIKVRGEVVAAPMPDAMK
ncbi:MAG: PaaI family thioesterase [Thermodesulfobacteriota bacterium]